MSKLNEDVPVTADVDALTASPFDENHEFNQKTGPQPSANSVTESVTVTALAMTPTFIAFVGLITIGE